MRLSRALTLLLYATFIGVLLASYVTVLQQISGYRSEIATLEENISEMRDYNATQRRLVEELNTLEGVERAARERYGMIRPGEEVYIVSRGGE